MSYQVVNHAGTNNGDPVRAPGTLTISTPAINDPAVRNPAQTSTRRIGSTVPKQVLRMISYRVEVKNDETALALGRVLVDLPFIDSNSMIDDTADSPTITLLLSDKAVTLNQNPGKVLMMGQDLGNQLNITVRDSKGVVLQGPPTPGDPLGPTNLPELISLTIEFQRDFVQAQ